MILAILLLLLLPTAAVAGDVTLEWNPATGATSYAIEQSIDQGATWTVVQTVGPTACTGTPMRCSVTHTAPTNGLVLFRYVAINAVGRTTRYSEGTWHCQSCAPPPVTTAVGVR